MSITTPPRNTTRPAATALLDRPTRTRQSSPVTPARPLRRTGTEAYTPNRKPRFQKSLGSKQVVSVRGRRVVQQRVEPARVKLTIAVTLCLIGTIVAAMFLSGRSTEQAFELQKLHAQEQQLNNQLETLNRDVEGAKASAEIARQAADKRMVVPDQPGVLVVENNGAITEQRPSKPEATRPIIDVNGAQVRPDAASSNPKDTKEVTNNVNAIPQPAAVPGVAPYAPRAAQPNGMGQGAR